MKTSLGVAIASVLFAGSSGLFGSSDPADRFLDGLSMAGGGWRESVERLFGPGRTHGLSVEFRRSPESVEHFVLSMTRTPQSWWRGGAELSGTATMEPAGQLTAFALYAATDADGDGHVSASEWTLVATAPLEESASATIARIPPSYVDADAFRFVTVDRVQGPWWHEQARDGLTYDDPDLAKLIAAH